MERDQFDSDVGKGGGIGREASAEGVEIGQPAGVEIGIDDCGEFALAGAIVGQRQQPDHGSAGPFLGVGGQQRLEGALIRATEGRERAFAIRRIGGMIAPARLALTAVLLRPQAGPRGSPAGRCRRTQRG